MAILMLCGLSHCPHDANDYTDIGSKSNLRQSDLEFDSSIKCDSCLPRYYLPFVCIQGSLIFGLQNVYGNVVQVFSVMGRFSYSKSVGNSFASIFWGAFIAGRLLCAGLNKMIPTKYLALFYPTTAFAASLFVIAELYVKEFYILDSVLLGLSTGPILPVILGWNRLHFELGEFDVTLIACVQFIGYMALAALTSYLVLSDYLVAFPASLCFGFLVLLILMIMSYVYLEKWNHPE
jgi:hypothetical protein